MSRLTPTHSNSLVGSAIASVILALGVAMPADAYPNNNRCGFATLVAVRGTGEAAGSGSANGGRTYASGGAGSMLGQLLIYPHSDVYLPVYTEAIAYPAAVYDAPSTLYPSSVEIGRANLAGELESLASACPNTNILLAGYSQGAQVIHAALTSKLSASARAHIKAVVLFGSPTYRPGEPWNAPGSGPLNGMFAAAPGSLSSWTAPAWNASYTALTQQPIVRAWCYGGDAFCQGAWPAGGGIHGSYGDSMAAAWSFIYSWITTND